uniref:NADH dehydrogenase subunit 6 n=1 Tax=Mycterothrips gongshanensis TaxID=2792509 RepID=UPI0022062224|nr:NADH dehydrogenase subunit 6 [Mycterothrips gongshanensis]UXW64202.1 NADH dehydrogenase subunit 6 [Mycterothrips gongshanensis]
MLQTMIMLKITKMFFTLMFMTMFLLMMLSNHPLILGLLVILQSIFISSIISHSFSITWFSFLIFMIYLGGILMLFSYIISLTKSEEPMIKKKSILIFFIMMILILWGEKEESLTKMSKMEVKNLLSSLFSNSLKISILMMIFLLLIMIMVVFLTESSKGSMRTM